MAGILAISMGQSAINAALAVRFEAAMVWLQTHGWPPWRIGRDLRVGCLLRCRRPWTVRLILEDGAG